MTGSLPPAADGGPRRRFAQAIAAAGGEVHPEDLTVAQLYADPGRYGWEQLTTITWAPTTPWALTVLWRHAGAGIVNVAFDRIHGAPAPFSDPAYLWEQAGEVVDIGVIELHCLFGLEGASAEDVPRLHAEIVGALDVVRPMVAERPPGVGPWKVPWEPAGPLWEHGDCCR